MESILSLTPSSHDDGATLVCRARSQALPSGKDTAITLSLQCEYNQTLALKEKRGLRLESRILGRRRLWTCGPGGTGNWSPGLLAQKEEETGDPACERLGIGLRCSMEVFQVLAHR